MASAILAEISRQDLVNVSAALASITDVKHLSSYNWIEAPTPTIAVPGSPPFWSPPSALSQLKKDSGLVYIAQNAARHPDSPLEPLFRALYMTNPSFDIRSTDVVTDRNNIRKLLSFVNPTSTTHGLEEFTINIEVAKNTAIFSRVETATHEYIGPREFRGFGHEFEKAYTTSQISGSTGHHRIISYRFGDLNFIIRHETDGYVETIPSSSSKEPKSNDISSMLESLSLSSTNSPSITPTGSKLTIKEEGKAVPLESTLEIKTRVFHRPLSIEEVAPQLWVSQTFNLVRAYHSKGKFKRPEVEDVAAEIKQWEDGNQTDLKKLAALIHKILGIVMGNGIGSVTIECDPKEDKLTVRKLDGEKMLPKDLYSKWDDKCDSAVDTENTKTNAGDEVAVKPVDEGKTTAKEKDITSSPGDTKDEKTTETVEEG